MNKNKIAIKSLKVGKKTEICAKPIVSPIAKYDASGNLFCVICKTIIKSHTVWKVHVNSKLHKLNVETAKKVNKTTLEKYISKKVNNSEEVTLCSNLETTNYKPKTAGQSIKKVSPSRDIEPTETLPETFFDNPSGDVKSHRAENKNHQNEEWEKFQLEIKETISANKLISGDQNNLELNKEITEISEQMQQWSKVIKLENKLLTIIKKQTLFTDTDEADENISDDEVDDHLDWRSKKFA